MDFHGLNLGAEVAAVGVAAGRGPDVSNVPTADTRPPWIAGVAALNSAEAKLSGQSFETTAANSHPQPGSESGIAGGPGLAWIAHIAAHSVSLAPDAPPSSIGDIVPSTRRFGVPTRQTRKLHRSACVIAQASVHSRHG
jgi:hypothetical protein